MTSSNDPQSIMDLLQGTPVEDVLNAPLPESPLASLQETPLGLLADTPVGEAIDGAIGGGLDGLPLPELPPLPEFSLPPNPIDALMQGEGLGIPGLDQLFAPFTDITGLFGTGAFSSLDPSAIIEKASGFIDQAMSMSGSALKTLDQVWQSSAATEAQISGQEAQKSGEELSDRGRDISRTTQTAAATVARGNANLLTVIESFVSTAAAAAPMIITPPGQALLMASAAEHLKAAVAIVTATRADLSEDTLTMNGLAAPIPVPAPPAAGVASPFSVANEVLEGVGKPMVSKVSTLVGDLAQTQAASATGLGLGTEAPTRTSAASFGGTGGGGSAGGGGAGGGIGGFGGGAGLVGAGQANLTSAPKPGSIAGTVPGAAVPAAAAGAGAAGAPMMGGGMGGGGMMGAGARGGGGDEEHTPRTPGGYMINPAGDDNAFTGDLGAVAPPVIGGAPEPFDDAEEEDAV